MNGQFGKDMLPEQTSPGVVQKSTFFLFFLFYGTEVSDSGGGDALMQMK
jgi:hypothetical protein